MSIHAVFAPENGAIYGIHKISNQLTACFTPKGDCWHYTYDAFGRRLSKTRTVDSDLAHIDPLFPQIKPKITTWRYLWSGDQLIEETPIYA
ncbi:RHS repeat domain-containing protein, partial [Proteus mirabilis]